MGEVSGELGSEMNVAMISLLGLPTPPAAVQITHVLVKTPWVLRGCIWYKIASHLCKEGSEKLLDGFYDFDELQWHFFPLV